VSRAAAQPAGSAPAGPIPENCAPNTHATVAGLLQQDPSCRRVLDIPSGAGAMTERLRRLGFDVHPADVVDLLQTDRTNFRQADMCQRLPYDDAAFDAVVSIDGIEHIERPFDFVRECRRVLRPGGRLLLSTPNVSSLRSRWRWWATGFHDKCKTPLDETAPDPLHHVNMLALPELRYLLHSNGFRIRRLATNRIKPIAWLYAPWLPVAWLLTSFVFHKEEKAPAQRARNREVLRAMCSRPVAFGEILIVVAERVDAAVSAAGGTPARA
jgi:2-polyprenyl-3-methyl-5-hydroxy-6-metoxy-1,4-benzoquinol methylase